MAKKADFFDLLPVVPIQTNPPHNLPLITSTVKVESQF